MTKALKDIFEKLIGSSLFIRAITILAILCSYIRIFFATEVTDEVYHVAGAS